MTARGMYRYSSLWFALGMCAEDCIGFLFSRNIAYLIDIGSDEALFPFATRLCYILWCSIRLIMCFYEVNWSFPRRVECRLLSGHCYVCADVFHYEYSVAPVWCDFEDSNVVLVLGYFASDGLDMICCHRLIEVGFRPFCLSTYILSSALMAECVLYV